MSLTLALAPLVLTLLASLAYSRHSRSRHTEARGPVATELACLGIRRERSNVCTSKGFLPLRCLYRCLSFAYNLTKSRGLALQVDSRSPSCAVVRLEHAARRPPPTLMALPKGHQGPSAIGRAIGSGGPSGAENRMMRTSSQSAFVGRKTYVKLLRPY